MPAKTVDVALELGLPVHAVGFRSRNEAGGADAVTATSRSAPPPRSRTQRTSSGRGVVSVAWDGDDPVLYLSTPQDYEGWFSVVLRSRTSAYNLLPTLQSAVAALDSTLPITDVESLNDHIQVSYAGQKIPAEMVAVYGACCLLVAILGVYAAMAYGLDSAAASLRCAWLWDRSGRAW